jgi:asparagine N-glycosylation enzyme membrane subunit Stt3
VGAHDRMAEKALANGKSPTAFLDAAKRHARASWFWVILAGVVWYFTDWWWALIPVAMLIFSVVQSISSTLIGVKLEKLQGKTPSASGDHDEI